MSLEKRAIATLTDVHMLNGSESENGVIKLAAARLSIDANAQAKKIVDAEIAKHPTALFFRAKAIAADEPNSNGDFFSSEELIKAAHTFVGVPFYTNHENTDITKAKGKIVFSEWIPDDKAIYVIGFIDREAYPGLCRGVEQDYMRGCFPPDAPVLMSNGIEKNIANVEIGDHVLSGSGNVKKVIGKKQREYDHPLLSIRAEGIEKPLICSEGHELVVYRLPEQCACGCGTILKPQKDTRKTSKNFKRIFAQGHQLNGINFKHEYLRKIHASEVKIGDLLVEPKINSDIVNVVSHDEAFLIGLFLAEGSFEKRNGIRHSIIFNFSHNELDTLAAECKRRLDKVFAKHRCHVTIKYYPESSQTRVCLYGKDVADWFYQRTGEYSDGKRLSEDLLNLDQETTASLIAGYMEGDGCCVGEKVYSFGTVSPLLCSQMRLLLNKIGIRSNYRVRVNPGHLGNMTYLPVHEIKFGNTTAETLTNKMVFKKSHSKYQSAKWHACDKYTLRPIKQINSIPYCGTVYDLEIDDDHTYCVNHLAVGNTSMGCVVEYSECSICGNSAATIEEYCPHVKFRKGRKFSGTAKNVKTGEIKNFKDALVYEINHGIRFIELSAVGDPACKSCLIEGIYDNSNLLKAASFGINSMIGQGGSFMSKVAGIENSLSMYKNTNLYKIASQQELQQIEQVLATLEQISVSLIKNRKRVEVEFASDLVKILSELQEFADELTGAGYGQLEGETGAESGDLSGIDSNLGDANPLPGPADGVPTASGATGMPVSDVANILDGNLGSMGTGDVTPSAQGVGSISGSPSNPVVTAPKMPTAPKKPLASGEAKLKRVAELVSSIKTALLNQGKNNEGEESMNRRTPVVASQERASIRQALSHSIKGSSAVLENVIDQERSTKVSGGSNMSETIVQTATRAEAPGVTTEKQLDSNLSLHPRTGVEQDSTQQSQLDGKRKGVEPETTMEDQLSGKRTDNAHGVTTEKQMANLHKEENPNVTQQGQLESNRTGTEQERTTEVQLDNKQSDLYARASMTRSKIKTAEQHAKAVIKVLAESAIRCSATPHQILKAASTLVDGTKLRATTLDMVTSASKSGPERSDSASIVARARYWGSKGVTLASATKEDMSSDIVAGLRTLVANDAEISPEAVMDVIDVVSSEDKAVNALSMAIDEAMSESQEHEVAASSMKNQIRAAVLAQTKVEVADGPKPLIPVPLRGKKSEVLKRDEEREQMKAAIASKKPTHIIEASFDEIGTTLDELKNNKKVAKKKIVDFVKRIAAMNNLTVEQKRAGTDGKPVIVASKVRTLKVANITNVTVDGADGTVQIAIQTDDGNTKADVSIPLDEQGADVEGAPLEGDATGEGLDNLLGGNTATSGIPPAPDAGVPPAAPSPNAPLPTAASKGKNIKTAQFGGNAGGLPGGGNLGGGQDPGSAVPQGMPAMDSGEGLQNFTDEKSESDEEKAPGVGEQMMPGSICPFCHGSDTTTGKKDLPPGAFECNTCGAVYEVHVNIEVLNPEGMTFEEGNGVDKITEPKIPEMPVAASIKLDKAGLEKVAACEQRYGHVCPACGMTECKPQNKTAGKVVYVCPSCETKSTKEILVASNKASFLQVGWTLNPKKVFSADCATCKQAALEYAALVKVTGMMKKAAESGKKPETAFPMANCAEYVARRFGANAVATFGPCKGKPLADCACKQLEAFGLRKRIDVEKLASVYAQPDPMEKCREIQKSKGYKQAQADVICNAMKKKYAKESDDNEWLEAFAGDSRFTTEELRVMKQKSNAMLSKGAQMDMGNMNLDADLGEPLDDVQPVNEDFVDNDEGTVTVEIPDDLAKELAEQIQVQIDAEKPSEELDELTPEEGTAVPEVDEELVGDIGVEAKSKTQVKTAATPKKVEDISSGVHGKVKGGTGTIGNEPEFDAKTPVIPSRGSASKIKGEKETIPEVMLPDIAADSATMGDESNTLKGTPSVSTEMRGRVIAEQSSTLTKEAKTPTQVEDISSGVHGKVKGGTGTIGNEPEFDAKKPVIPSKGSASEIAGEKETIPEASLPDIPADSATMGDEANTLKGTPPVSTDIRGRVLADAKRDQQIEKIMAARHKKACQVAAKWMGMGRIAETDYDAVVEDLSKVETDRIEAFAERMFRSVKTATAVTTLSTPIVQEASAYKPSLPKTLAEQLRGIFTFGTKELHQRVIEDDKKDEENFSDQ